MKYLILLAAAGLSCNAAADMAPAEIRFEPIRGEEIALRSSAPYVPLPITRRHATKVLLEVDPTGLDLNPLKLGTDADLVPGQPVAAIGSPFGQQHSLSVGIISATDRSVKSLTQFQIGNAIQTDAAVNHGNSGGPLIDAAGEVVGVTSQIASASQGNVGIGFAVPINTVRSVAAQLVKSGTVTLGIKVARRLRKNANTTSTTKSTLSSNVSCTSSTEARMVCARSMATCEMRRSGSCAVPAE